MGFGSQPYGHGPAGIAYPNPAEELRGKLPSSRKIDAVAGAYALQTDGSNAIDGMDDMLQVVYLTICYNVKRGPLISKREEKETRLAIENALRFLTSGESPSIRIERIDLNNDKRQTSWCRVVFKNLKRNTMQSVEL